MLSTPTNSKTSDTEHPEEVHLQLSGYFKTIDDLIRDRKFDEARKLLAEAERMDPTNVFITAFTDRISLFEKKGVAPAASVSVPTPDSRPLNPEPISLPTSLMEELGLKQQFADHYARQMQLLEKRFNAAQAEMLERERTLLAKRELKVREEYRQQMERYLLPAIAPQDSGEVLRMKMEARKMRDELAQKLDRQLGAEREIFARQYSAEHGRLQQVFLREQKKLLEEQHQKMAEQLRNLRKRETEEFQRKWLETHTELESTFQRQLEEHGIAETSPPPASPVQTTVASESLPMSFPEGPGIDDAMRIRRELRDEMEREFLKRMEKIMEGYNKKMDLLGFIMPTSKTEAIALYRKKIREYSAEGPPTVEQARQLMECKELLELTFDEHAEIERSVRLELYMEQLERLALAGGGANPQAINSLETLKTKFGITPDEAAEMEPYFISMLQRLVIKGRILIADDEQSIRDLLGEALSANGYQVISCESVPVAIEVLKREAVDLIISDLRFGPGEPDGFKFFSLVQKETRLQRIPFLMLSALTDDIYVKSGVQLGIDDYLAKPVNPEYLLAIVEGKIKRYRSQRS